MWIYEFLFCETGAGDDGRGGKSPVSDKTKVAELRSRSSSTNSSQGESPVRGTRDPSPAQVL